MVKKDSAASPPATEFREGTSEGSEMRVKKAKDSRRKRRELRRMKPSAAKDANFYNPTKPRPNVGTENNSQEPSMEISLSFPASSSSSENDDIKGEDETSRCSGSHGFISILGRRREMEDAVAIELGFTNEYDFYGVYDGHGGWHVAKECKDTLHHIVAKEMIICGDGGGERKKRLNWEKVMVGSFGKMDEVVKEVGEDLKTIGSTAVISVVGKEEIVVANCGDSRAVICRGGVAVALSNDHKPDRPDELERVEAAGGKVINWNGYRVLGVLATSRSVGDAYLRPFIISEPEVQICERTKRDEFLILASDGLWDVVSNDMACRIVRKCLYGHVEKKELKETNRATKAASLLAELAMSRGSRDNISAIVVQLRKSRLTASTCS